MSRTEWDDDGGDYDYNIYGLQIGWALRALKGKKGQAALKELEAALLALPEKRLIAENFCKEGQVCVLGALALKRRLDVGMSDGVARKDIQQTYGLDPDPEEAISRARKDLGLSRMFAIEVMEQNDKTTGKWIKEEGRYAPFTPQERYEHVLAWVRMQMKEQSSR